MESEKLFLEAISYMDRLSLEGDMSQQYDHEFETLRLTQVGPIVRTRTFPGTIQGKVVESGQRPKEPSAEEKLDRLEKEHTLALLKLKSARRILALWRNGIRGVLAGLLLGVSMILVAALGIGDGFTWLVGTTFATLSALGSFAWVYAWRLKVEDVGGRYNYKYRVVEYIDPKLNVDIAEIEYAQALRKLTEVTGA